MSYAWYDVLGNIGVCFILITYLMLQIGRLPSDGVWYSALNAAGAGMILVSLCYAFNLSAFLVEAFWVGISLIGLLRAWRKSGRVCRDNDYFTSQQ